MRILSYNIHKGIGGRDRQYRIERIVEVIEAENPDLICLQEVDRNVRRSKFHDQPALLASHFKSAERLFQMNVHLTTGGYGNLILSRWPFKAKHQVSLRQFTKKPRGAQAAVVETPDGEMLRVNWHLGLSEKERHWQVKQLLSHGLFRECHTLPTLIIGDFNDWRNTLTRNQLTDDGFTQVTAPISRFRSFPAYMPVGSLDKCYVRGALDVRHAKVVRTNLARRASDHLPLVVDFHLLTTAPPPAELMAGNGA
jgi:endonuclease/exonuclease/phosphatase family metal-dependent hydrolase